jgi:PAS domain S-box-containing protein
MRSARKLPAIAVTPPEPLKTKPDKTRNTGRRIAFYVLLALVPLLVAAGFYLTWSAQKKIERAYYAIADSVSAFVIRELEQEKENLNHSLDFWVSNPSFDLAFESASSFDDTSSLVPRAEQVQAKLSLDGLEVADRSGKVLVALRKGQKAAHESELATHFRTILREGKSFSGIETIDDGFWIVCIVPVRPHQTVGGAVAFFDHVNSDYLRPIREVARADIVILRGSEVVAASPPELAKIPFDREMQSPDGAASDRQHFLIENGGRSYIAIRSPLLNVDEGRTPASIVVLLDASAYRAALVDSARSWFAAIGVLSLAVILVAFYVGRTIDQINRTVVEGRDYTDSIIKAMTHTLLVVRPDRGIQSVNGAALKLLGYREEDLVGSPVSRVMASGASALVEVAAKGDVHHQEVSYRTKDGAEVPMSFSASALRDSSGAVNGIVCIAEDISERKQAEAQLEKVNRELLDASRQAGMAEVAASVLHNVGNVLNSVNISGSVIADKIATSKAGNLGRAVALLQANAGDLPHFLTEDPKGKLLPGYLADLASHLDTEQEEVRRELELLLGNIKHIKEIVGMQQSYARISGLPEECDAVELVDNALQMNENAFERHGVKVIREYGIATPVLVEKHKLLQILVNLLRNAKFACDDSGRTDKEVRLRVTNGDGRIQISVKDNGVGIPEENLTRIFRHGFTTRKDGHGFGLHGAALAATEMGGSLGVFSEGLGKGATFTLDLPLRSEGISHES